MTHRKQKANNSTFKLSKWILSFDWLVQTSYSGDRGAILAHVTCLSYSKTCPTGVQSWSVFLGLLWSRESTQSANEEQESGLWRSVWSGLVSMQFLVCSLEVPEVLRWRWYCMLLTSNGSCYVGECSVPTAIPEQAGDSKMDCPSTPSNSYPGTSMGRELLHVDYFSDARSKAVHCVCSTPAGVF